MSDERFAAGSREEFEHRGHKITVWRTFKDDGRRIHRKWHFETCGVQNDYNLKTKEEAISAARRTINYQIDGRFYWDMLHSIYEDDVPPYFYDNHVPQEIRTAPDTSDDRRARVKEWLKSVTVARGFSAAEEATAKQKLAQMAKAA